MVDFIHNAAEYCRFVFDNFKPILNDIAVIMFFVIFCLIVIAFFIYIFWVFLAFVLSCIDRFKEDIEDLRKES